MAASPGKSLGAFSVFGRCEPRYRVASELPVGPRSESLPRLERYVCWIDLGGVWWYDWWPRVVASDLRPLLCLPLGPRLEALGLLPVAWVSMTLGGLLASAAGGRTKTKQAYRWFCRRMELFLGLYMKPQAGILLPGHGPAFSKGPQSQDPLGFTFSCLKPKAPQKSLLPVDKLSDFHYWERIPMGDFPFCPLSDVTQHTSF